MYFVKGVTSPTVLSHEFSVQSSIIIVVGTTLCLSIML